MANLKALKGRIASVKSTQKITKAMKMVAAAKLRRAQDAAEAGRPYAERLAGVMSRLASGVTVGPESPKLLAGTGKDDVHPSAVSRVRSTRTSCVPRCAARANWNSRVRP